MDHANAHLMEFTEAPIQTTTITSGFTHDDKMHSLSKNENLMHNKEQHEQASYYKALAAKMVNYNHVLLFGPTQAKKELLNIVRAEHRLEKVRVDVKQTDKMTENQQHAYVKEFFSNDKIG